MICAASQSRMPCGVLADGTISCGDLPLSVVGVCLGRLERIREDVPVLQPEHSLQSPQATESDHISKEVLQFSKSLMEEDGGIKPHRAHTRLTVYKAVSTLNGLRLPHQGRLCFPSRRHRQNLEPPTGLEPATVPYEGAALSV